MKKILNNILIVVLLIVCSVPVSYGATLTVYPDPDAESTSVDGHVFTEDSTWAATHDAATGSVADDSTMTPSLRVQQTGAVYRIYRWFMLFDTSALGSTATVSAATSSIFVHAVTANSDNDGLDYLGLYASTPAANTAIATADFDQVGTTLMSATKPDLSSVSTAAYTDYTLNAAGTSSIAITGITKFSIREGHDAEDSAITNATNNQWSFRSADTADVTSDPKLVITYTTSTPVLRKLRGVGITR